MPPRAGKEARGRLKNANARRNAETTVLSKTWFSSRTSSSVA